MFRYSGEQRITRALVDDVTALLVTHKVHIATQTAWRQVFAVIGRVLVKTARGTLELVLQTEQAGRLTLDALQAQIGIAADARERYLVQNQEQKNDHDNLFHLHFYLMARESFCVKGLEFLSLRKLWSWVLILDST